MEYTVELFRQADEKAIELVQELKNHSVNLALAESCTTGLVSSLIGDVPGASQVFWGSFMCYSQKAKESMLDLDHDDLDTYGLVSSETACSMVERVLDISDAYIAASVTGIAGPDGDGSDVPVGTVWIATARKDGDKKVKEFFFEGSRNEIRMQAAIAVLEAVKKALYA